MRLLRYVRLPPGGAWFYLQEDSRKVKRMQPNHSHSAIRRPGLGREGSSGLFSQAS